MKHDENRGIQNRSNIPSGQLGTASDDNNGVVRDGYDGDNEKDRQVTKNTKAGAELEEIQGSYRIHEEIGGL
ncbi:hypothetical protein MRB53_026428 [Persea americana]|uniref:Uncharacterized protein n=1 Tax=Persea americana TaxID=3435 RepID=A0ACC2LJ35_PERAE|nr:hypothetical protein MRB53_026428 [Persea americana]